MSAILHLDDSTRGTATESDWLALVRAIGAGDQLALSRLYERAHPAVFTIMFRITREREIAEELTLETFYDVWYRARRYSAANGTVLGWVMSLARARATAHALVPRTSPAIAEQRRFLRLVYSVLTFAERRAVEFTFFAGQSYDEAATSLDEPPATVRTRLRVALQKLRRVLAERPAGT